jgi:putative transposase
VGLGDFSRGRAPHRHGRAMAKEVAQLILGLRRRRRYWGPRKLKAVLERNHPEFEHSGGQHDRRSAAPQWSLPRAAAPVASSAGTAVRASQRTNDLWCADFKGWFRTADGQRWDPLTITDAYSRFLLECRIVAPSHAQVKLLFERAFRRYGYPRTIRTDNGEPFASAGTAGLSRLSVQ